MIPDDAEAHPLETHLRAQLQGQWPAPSKDAKLYIGLSGGADSSALLIAVVRAFRSTAVTALHANHNLNPRSDDWAQHCRDLCARLNVELIVANLQLPPGNVEAAARQVRYEFFREQLGSGDLLLLGHHSQDQLETIFMRLIQGRSMVPMREQGRLGAGHFLRPLLSVERPDLIAYLQRQGASWLEDPSNQDQGLTRNFLRHSVIQPLLARWPKLAGTVRRVAQEQNAQYQLLRELLTQVGDEFSLEILPRTATSLRVWLRIYLERRGHFSVTDKALDEFARQLNQAEVSRLNLNAEAAMLAWRGRGYYEPVLHQSGKPPIPEPARLEPEKPTPFAGKMWLMESAPATASDSFSCSGAIYLCSRRADLSMYWCGRDTGVDDLLRQLRVPPWRRASIPLLVHQDDIVAVPGLTVSERYRTAPTERLYWRLRNVAE